MSEKIKKTNIQSVEKALEIISLSPNKQKHNSKRRSKKNKAEVEPEIFKSESNKVDEVVNYLCSAISKTENETIITVTPPVKIPYESPHIRGDLMGLRCYQISGYDDYKQRPSTSSGQLDTLFKNLQVCTEKTSVKSSNITDFLNVQLLKKNYCECLSIEDLERLKFKKLKEKLYLNGLKSDISKNMYQELFNLNFIKDCSQRQFLRQPEKNSSHLIIKTKEQLQSTNQNSEKKKQSAECNNFNLVKDCFQKSLSGQPETNSSHLFVKTKEPLQSTNQNFEKTKKLTECINGNKLLCEKDEFETLIQHTPELFSNNLKEALENESSKKDKIQKKKNKNLKNNKEIYSGIQTSSRNQKVLLELSQDCNEPSVLKSNNNNKRTKRQQNLRTALPAIEHAFPKYLSVNELQSLSKFGVLMSGIIRINPKNYKEAYITAPDKGMDILIEGLKDRNRALEGDEVYFVLKAKEYHRITCDSTDLQRTAVVVGIKTLNHNRGAIGTLHMIKNRNNSFVLFSPRDSKLPRLRIQRNNWPKGFLENSESFKNKLFFAKIFQWNDLRYADGELIKEIGEVGEVETETEAILLKLGLNVTPYGEFLKKSLPPTNFEITDADIVNREDFRKDCVFTVDPDSAVDLDDAVSCKRLPNGNYEVGVHISDVSYFLKEGTPLDSAVAKRATTVYLVQKAYHMLPFELCRLCSLTPGEDKLSFSVIWEITPDCDIVRHRFTRSIINSCAQFSYAQVQSIIDNSPDENIIYPKIHGKHTPENIKEIIFFLHKVAIFLRNNRFKNGALKIDQKKIHFLLDENRLPVNYIEYSQKQSHQIIEEFMLLANITVAEKLNSSFPSLAFLRSHPPPLPYVLKKLQKTLEKYGIILDISSSKSLQSSLLRYSGEDYESVARMLVLNNALAKPMTRAKYYCSGLSSNEEERRHYALCVPLYTHFTSPIRRYADVMVHRLLAATLQYCNPPKWTSENVQQIAENCNKKKYAAKLAEEMSIELYHNLYVGLQGSVICDAVVCDVKDKSFDCIGLTTGIHQRLYFEHIQGEVNQIKEDGIWRLTIKWPISENYETETIQIVEMFSIVKIELKRINFLKITASLLRNE